MAFQRFKGTVRNMFVLNDEYAKDFDTNAKLDAFVQTLHTNIDKLETLDLTTVDSTPPSYNATFDLLQLEWINGGKYRGE